MERVLGPASPRSRSDQIEPQPSLAVRSPAAPDATHSRIVHPRPKLAGPPSRLQSGPGSPFDVGGQTAHRGEPQRTSYSASTLESNLLRGVSSGEDRTKGGSSAPSPLLAQQAQGPGGDMDEEKKDTIAVVALVSLGVILMLVLLALAVGPLMMR